MASRMNLIWPAWIGCFGLAASTVCYATPVLRVLQSTSTDPNLLRNAGFELRQGAQFPQWRSAPQGFRVAEREGRAGSVALACDATDTSGWHGASQSVALDQDSIAPIVVRGWSKAENVMGGADSGYSLYVDILYRDGTPLWGQTVNFRAGTHDWELREFVILPDKPVQNLTVHCIFRGHSGKVWFDDVHVAENKAPSGTVMFQGTPMIVGELTTSPTAALNRYSTQDGLSLGFAAGRVQTLQVNGRELAAPVASGFLARDVAAGSDMFRFGAEGSCPELDLRLETRVTAHPRHLTVNGRLTDLTGRDRAILLAFALPIDATGWTWDDDIRRQRSIEGTGEFAEMV